jgi:hypothetical protein
MSTVAPSETSASASAAEPARLSIGIAAYTSVSLALHVNLAQRH